MTDYRLMQVKTIAEYIAILSTYIKLPFVFKTFVILEWPRKTGLTVKSMLQKKYTDTHTT